MTIAYPHVAERLFGRAHAIEPNAFRAIVEGPIGQRVLAGERIDIKQSKKTAKASRAGRILAITEAEPVQGGDGMIEYGLTRDGVAILSVQGALSRRFDWLAAACGFATYEGMSASIDAALSDYRVRALMFDVDSPGGQADGMLDLADQILAAREKLPVWAVANSVAASAAYALAGSAEKLFLPRLGQVGSIGAVMVHIDQSVQDQARGVKYTAIYSGTHKIDGWEHAALSPAARAAAQGRIDHCRDELCALVGRQGRMSAKAALATEAALYSDSDAVSAGLANGVCTFDAALAELTELVLKSSSTPTRMAANSTAANKGTDAMTTQKDQMLNGASPTAVVAAQASASATPPKPGADPATAAADAPAPAVNANLPNPPKAGEKCQTCGQMMPDDDDGEPTDPDSKTPGYTVEMAMETMDLCAIAKVPVSEAKAFVAAKTPIATVREKLAAKAAAATDAQMVDGTARPNGAKAETDVATAWDEVVTEQNAKLQGAKR